MLLSMELNVRLFVVLKRRSFLLALGATTISSCVRSPLDPFDSARLIRQNDGKIDTGSSVSEPSNFNWDEYVTDAIDRFPFELVRVPGARAELELIRLAETEAEHVPIILGDGNSVALILDGMEIGTRRSKEEVLASAQMINHPNDLFSLRAREETAAKASLDRILQSENPTESLPGIVVMEPDGSFRKLSAEEVLEAHLSGAEEDWPPVGEWPTETISSSTTLQSIIHWTGDFLPEVFIGLLPTRDWAEVPAMLSFGGWNACPPPEFHVAAFESWRERYDAKLLSMTHDTVELQIGRNPETRSEAMELSEELYAYCNDLIDQGVESLSALAAITMSQSRLSIWWD